MGREGYRFDDTWQGGEGAFYVLISVHQAASRRELTASRLLCDSWRRGACHRGPVVAGVSDNASFLGDAAPTTRCRYG